MTALTTTRWCQFLAPPLFSPLGFLVRAVWLAVFFAVCHLAGLREHTAFLSGTPGASSMSLTTSAILGVIYMAAYYGFVLIAPVLMIASIIQLGIVRVLARPNSAVSQAAKSNA